MELELATTKDIIQELDRRGVEYIACIFGQGPRAEDPFGGLAIAPHMAPQRGAVLAQYARDYLTYGTLPSRNVVKQPAAAQAMGLWDLLLFGCRDTEAELG